MFLPLFIRVGHGHPSLGCVGEAQAGFDGCAVWRGQLTGPSRFHGEQGDELGVGELSAEEGFPDDEAAAAFAFGPVGAAEAALAFDDGAAAGGAGGPLRGIWFG